MENSEGKDPNTSDAELEVPVEGEAGNHEDENPAEAAESVSDDDLSPELMAAMEQATAAEGEGLDKAVSAWRAVIEAHPESLAPRLEFARVYRDAEKWRQLGDVLKDAVDVARSVENKTALLRELANLYIEQLRNESQGINALKQITEVDPKNLEVYDELASYYENKRRWPDMVAMLNQKAENIDDHDKKVEIFLGVADLYINRFSNQAEAIKAFERVLEVDPENPRAAEHLVEVYEKRRDWEKLLNLREKEIDRTDDPGERAAKTLELAQLAATRIKKPDVCTYWWERVLNEDPAHEEAIAELNKLYERSKDWEKLAEICTKQAFIASDDKTKVDALQKLGLLYTDRIENPDKAIDAWRQLLSIDPNHRRAQDSLKKLYIAAKNWDDLEGFYREQEKLDEYVRVIEREVDSGDEEDQLPLAMRVALLYRDELEKDDRAMRAFEKVLTIDEQNLQAAEALIPLYEGGRDPRKLVNALEIQLASTEDPALRQERIKRLAEYSEERLRDKGAAFGWWLKAHEEDHQADWIRTELERLAAEIGAFAELAEAYVKSYERFDDPVQLLPLMLVVARIQEEELGEIDKALDTNRAILDIDASNEAAITALQRLYLGKQNYESLLDIYQRKLELTEDVEERTQIFFKIGQLYEEEVGDDDRAVAAYLSIIDAEGEVPTALRALDRVYLRNAQHEELADVLERQIVIADPEEDQAGWIELKYRLGQVREQALDDVAGAIDCYHDILEVAPTHDGAREALENRLSDDEHKLAAAGILEPIYEQLSQWAQLVGVHEIQLAASDDQLHRVDLLMRIGALHGQMLGDAESAFNAYARCFREDPAAEGAKTQLEELCALLDEGWPRLVKLFEEALERPDIDPLLGHELATKVANAYEVRLENSEKAVEFFRRALLIEPDDIAAINALEMIFSRDEKYPELLEVYRRKADIATEEEERLNILFRIAAIHEEMLQSPEDAISAYNEILGHDPDNLQALRALDRLYVQGEQWRDLGDTITRQLVLCEDDRERVVLLVRLAYLRETHLEELAAAIETYRQVLDFDPRNHDAVQALERLIEHEDHELTIAQILEPIYQTMGSAEELIRVYQIMAKHAYDPERKDELLHQIARIYEDTESGDEAFDTYARAFRGDPGSDATQAQLERLARRLDRWPDLVKLYDLVIDEIGDESLQVQLLFKLAQIYELELANDQSAVATYNRILEVAPSQVEAATAIQQIHERNADYASLVVVLKRKSEMLMELAESKALLYKAAQIEVEVLEDLDAAIATYQMVLDLDDMDMPAMNALVDLYIRLERWEPLKDVYAKQADLAEDPEEKKNMLYVLGQVYDAELGDVGKAIETYQGILDIDPDALPAIQHLDRLYTTAERWYDLLQNLEQQVLLAESTGEVVGLKYRIGKLWEDKLHDLARSIESYREALGLDPGHYETMVALDQLMRAEEGEPVMAAQVLEPIYEASFEFAKLVDVLEVMVKHSEDVDERLTLLHRIAELHEYRLENAELAFAAHSRALREDSGNEHSLAHLERLAEYTNGWESLVELYGTEAEKTLDVPRQVDLLSRLARVQEDEVVRPEDAIATYKRILEVDFDNKHALLSLDRLYTGSQQWEPLAKILRRESELAESDQEIVELQFRLGQVLEQALQDLPGAIDVYRDILIASPEHAPTLNALELIFLDGQHELQIATIIEPLYEASGEWEKLHKIYEVQLSKLEDMTDRQSMFQRLAELAEANLLDAERAFHWWGEAACEDPNWGQAIEEAERLAGQVGLWGEMVNVYIRILERHLQDSDIQRQILLRLARVYDFELGDIGSAISTHLRVLEIDAQDVDALAALDRLYEGAGMFDELVDILARRIQVTLDGDEIIEFHFRRGRIYADAIGDLEASLKCYEAVLEQEARNRQALEACEVIFFRREEWQRMYDNYEKMIDVADGDAELGDIYASMARLSSDALESDDGAIDMWSRVLDIRGEDPQALAALAELYGRLERWEDLVEIIERQVMVAESAQVQIDFYKRLGRVWSEKLERDRNALDAWRCADELNSEDLETLRALAHLYHNTQAWEELSSIIRRIIEVGQITGGITEDEMIDLYAQLGGLEGEILNRVDDAVDAWRKVAALDPSDLRALAALEKLFTREARWEECIEVLEKRSFVLDSPQDRIDTLLQAAAIWEEKVYDHEQAAGVYERVRASDPGNAIASERLEAIYRAGYHWEQLTEVLLERVEMTESISERIDSLGAVARIYEEELGDQDAAFVVLQAAFKEDYSHERTAKELERLAEATHRWEELLTDYTEVVQSLEHSEPESACDLWVKIGRWYGDALAHIDYAIHSVEQALRLDENHLGALSAMADFQRKRQSWPELIDTLRRHASVEPNTNKKVDLYLDLADLLEGQMHQHMEAIAAYQSAVQADPSCMDALRQLERLYRQNEMWEQLIDVLGRMSDLRTEESEIIKLKLEVGQLWDVRMLDSSRAIGAYRDVLSIDPSNLPALRALEQLYEKTGQSEQYLEILEAQLDVSPTEQVSLYERMSSAWEERFGKLDRAADCLEKIVAIDERNFNAYRELARLYRQAEKWDSLVDTYRNHIMATNDPATRIDLYCDMGTIYESKLSDPDRAIEAYQDVLTFDPDEPRALDALGRLYESISEWDRAIDSMQQLVATTDAPAKQVDLYHRIGRIQAWQLYDGEQAEAQLLRALTIDESHTPTMMELVKLYSDRGDWLKAAQMMGRAETHTPNQLDKIRLLYDAARIYLDRLSDKEQAKEYLAAVISLDPEHVDAAEPLSEIYFAEEQWHPLMPLLDMLVRKAQQEHRDPRELNEMYYRTARCADEIGDFDKALQFYRAAYDIDSTYLPTLVGRADLLYKMQQWEEAGKIYQTILVQHHHSQGEADVVRIYYRLGMVRQHLGERRKALNMFEKALEIDPTHRDTLEAVIALQTEQQDFEAVIQAKRSLLATADEAESVKLLDEIGDIYVDKLGNSQKAISAYLEALDIEPENHQLLQKVLERYTETQQWKKAVSIIERFIELEKDPRFKGSYYQAAGTICRDELKSLDEALDYYEKALDSFFSDPSELPENLWKRALKAFQAIDKMLTTKRDWKAQERSYRRMIKRLSDGKTTRTGVLVQLWHSLGEIYRSRLKHYKSAIQAFEIAKQLDPTNSDRKEILAELYLVAGPDHLDNAVALHMEMLHEDPFKYDSYKALYRIYMDAHQYDKAWCISNTLAFLKKAEPEQMQFYEQYKPRGFVKAKQPMNAESWRNLYHPNENRYISAIFGAIWQGPATLRALPHKNYGLRKKDRRDIANDQLLFSKIFYYVAQVIGFMPPPDVYLLDNRPGEIQLVNLTEKKRLAPPSFVVGQNLLQGRPEKEVAFISAKYLGQTRPEHYLRLALSTNTERKVALLSAIVLVQPNFPVPPELHQPVAQYAGEMRNVLAHYPQIYEQLGALVQRFLKNAPEVDLARWAHAVDATSYRLGFVLCGDLEVAARLVSADPVMVGGPQPKDKIKELILYSVSEDYFAVRKQLGLQIG